MLDQQNTLSKPVIKEIAGSRTRLAKQALLSLISTNKIGLVSVNQIINCLCLLVQEPILVFLYKENNDTHEYERFDFFDVAHALRSRDKKLSIKTAENKTISEPEEKLPLTHELFKIFKTDYFVRVFWLNAQSAEKCFSEILPSEPYKKNFKEQVSFYISECTSRLFDFATEEKYLGQTYTNNISNDIVTIIERTAASYKISNDKEKLLSPISIDNYITDGNTPYYQIVRSQFFEILKEAGGYFDRAHQKAGRTAVSLSDIISENRGVKKAILPNVFYMFRSFDRKEMRYQQNESVINVSDEGDRFGYPYNVFFILPDSQRESIEDYFENLLLRKEKGQKIRKFGSWIMENEEKPNLISLIKELDQRFWEELKMGGAKKIIEILEAPVGSKTTSFSDPLFYGGLVHYRYPFRLMAGLARIDGLGKEHDTSDIDVTTLDSLSKNGMLNDGMQAVIFYYMSLGMLPEYERDFYKASRTKLVLYPIEVCGDVVGLIGSFVLTPKNRTSIIGFKEWNFIFRMYMDSYAVAIRDIRRVLRDSQIDLIAKWLKDAVIKALSESGANQHVDGHKMDERFADQFFKGYSLSRFNPYPHIKLSWSSKLASKDDSSSSNETGATIFEMKYQKVGNKFFDRFDQIDISKSLGSVDEKAIKLKCQRAVHDAVHTVHESLKQSDNLFSSK